MSAGRWGPVLAVALLGAGACTPAIPGGDTKRRDRGDDSGDVDTGAPDTGDTDTGATDTGPTDSGDTGVDTDTGSGDTSEPVDTATTSPYTGGWSVGACADGVRATGNAVGQVAQDFALLDQHGDTVHLHDFCDRVVWLVFAAFW